MLQLKLARMSKQGETRALLHPNTGRGRRLCADPQGERRTDSVKPRCGDTLVMTSEVSDRMYE